MLIDLPKCQELRLRESEWEGLTLAEMRFEDVIECAGGLIQQKNWEMVSRG